MAKTIGRFNLKRTKNGNLVGEFSSDSKDLKGKWIFTEGADLQDEKSDGYPGKYSSTWQEDGTPHFADLVIEPLDGGLFKLLWTEKPAPHAKKWKGVGMLCDDVLMGDYRGS